MWIWLALRALLEELQRRLANGNRNTRNESGSGDGNNAPPLSWKDADRSVKDFWDIQDSGLDKNGIHGVCRRSHEVLSFGPCCRTPDRSRPPSVRLHHRLGQGRRRASEGVGRHVAQVFALNFARRAACKEVSLGV